MKEEYSPCTVFDTGDFFFHLVGSSGSSCPESNSVQVMSPRLVYVCFRDRQVLPSEQCAHLTKQERCQAGQPVQKGSALSVCCAAQHLSLQVMLGWVSAAKLTESRGEIVTLPTWDEEASNAM